MSGDSGLVKNTGKTVVSKPSESPVTQAAITPVGGGHPLPVDPQQVNPGSLGTPAVNNTTTGFGGNNSLPNGPRDTTAAAQTAGQADVNTSTDPNVIIVNGKTYKRSSMSEKAWLALRAKYPLGTGTDNTGGTGGTGNTNTGTKTSTDGAYDPLSILDGTQSVNIPKLGSQVPNINPDTPGTSITAPQQGATPQASASTATAAQAQTVSAGNAAQASNVSAKPIETYQAATTLQDVLNNQMTAAQGEVNPDHLIDPAQYDVEGLYTGVNADGSTNWAGQALNDWAEQNLDEVDDRATMKGQLALLQSEFTDANGNPTIPSWASATARSVGRIAAFNGVTGTAATAAMAQALLEASLPIAQNDANVFATLTIQNLNNKQASILNKANVLAKFELTNLDNRMLAAVENSKAFLEMDLQNLANEQQAAVINTQARVQSILEDAKAINTQRMFTAQSTNEQNRFYDELNSQIDMYNTGQVNSMAQFNAAQANQVNIANAQMKTATSQFNAGQLNQISMFNANMEMQQDQFYKTMQYNVDIANAQWRQTVTLTNAQMQFEAAALDVRNQFSISQEALNRVWDRTDQILNYAWQSSENALERSSRIALAQLQGDMAADVADAQGTGALIGSIVSAGASSFFKDFDWDFF